jgi:hypothetical protein
VRKWFSSRASTFYFLSVVVLGGFLPDSDALGQEGVYNCRFASIHYQDPVQLERFAEKIQPGALTLSLNQIFMAGGKAGPETRAGRHVDQLFQRVQSVLEMPKPDLKIQIRLFRNQEDLSQAFEKIAQRPTQSPAFYWKENNTIYVHMEKVSLGILAHEMAHAVIAHYFIISPPEKISELLCQYVDREVSKGSF